MGKARANVCLADIGCLKFVTGFGLLSSHMHIACPVLRHPKTNFIKIGYSQFSLQLFRIM